jgi:hypothetical protein
MKADVSRFQRAGCAERGSATLVVFILLTIMVALIVANTVTLHHLRGELRLIERGQLKKYGTIAPPVLRARTERHAP